MTWWLDLKAQSCYWWVEQVKVSVLRGSRGRWHETVWRRSAVLLTGNEKTSQSTIKSTCLRSRLKPLQHWSKYEFIWNTLSIMRTFHTPKIVVILLTWLICSSVVVTLLMLTWLWCQNNKKLVPDRWSLLKWPQQTNTTHHLYSVHVVSTNRVNEANKINRVRRKSFQFEKIKLWDLIISFFCGSRMATPVNTSSPGVQGDPG